MIPYEISILVPATGVFRPVHLELDGRKINLLAYLSENYVGTA